jgi:hypothetical protein
MEAIESDLRAAFAREDVYRRELVGWILVRVSAVICKILLGVDHLAEAVNVVDGEFGVVVTPYDMYNQLPSMHTLKEKDAATTSVRIRRMHY